MNAAEVARRKLASAPADFLFAVQFSPRAQRAALTALLAVFLEILEVLHECSERAVAQAKLGWWREEVLLLSEHRPRHPLAIYLAEFLPQSSACSGPFVDIIESVAADLSPPTFQRFQDVERYCQHRGGALLQLTALTAGAAHAATATAASNLGTAWQLANNVVRSGQDARRGRVYFAAEDLRRHGLDRHVVAGAHSDAGLKALLADYARKAQARAHAASQQECLEPQTLVAARVLDALVQARLKRFIESGYDTGQPPVELTPFAQLLTAWRCARGWQRK